jgi:hypothetical protein
VIQSFDIVAVTIIVRKTCQGLQVSGDIALSLQPLSKLSGPDA